MTVQSDVHESALTASQLLDQQMWCFGQDIEYPHGNLLIRFGFARHRKPASNARISAYSFHPAPGSQIVLWGFGLFYGAEGYGGMFLRRFQFCPTWTAAPALSECVWDPENIPDLRTAASAEQKVCVRHLLADALAWLAGYESWILDTVGVAYRQDCLERWPKAVLEAERVPDEWRRLATRWGVQ